MLGQLTGQEKPDGGLDLPRGDGGPLVVVSESAGLSGDSLKDVVHEGVHDGHNLGGDASVRVHLFQYLEKDMEQFKYSLQMKPYTLDTSVTSL